MNIRFTQDTSASVTFTWTLEKYDQFDYFVRE